MLDDRPSGYRSPRRELWATSERRSWKSRRPAPRLKATARRKTCSTPTAWRRRTVRGRLPGLGVPQALLPDTALRRRVAIPALIRLRGSAGRTGDVLDGFDTLDRRRRTFREGAVQPPRTELRRRDPGRQLPAQQFPPGRFAGDRRPGPASPRHGFDPLLPRIRTSLRRRSTARSSADATSGASNSTQNSTASVFRDGSPTATRRSGCCCPSPER